MPIDILRESLRSLKTGELAAFHYDFFPGIFPSGELDAGAWRLAASSRDLTRVRLIIGSIVVKYGF